MSVATVHIAAAGWLIAGFFVGGLVGEAILALAFALARRRAATVFHCPECGRAASVPPWCTRPICVHAWKGGAPEIWDGDDVDGEGRAIEQSPNEKFRAPGAHTWSEMVRR